MYMKLIFSLHRAVELAVRRVALEQVREFHERVVDDHQLVLNGCQWRLTQAAVVVSWENLFLCIHYFVLGTQVAVRS